MEVVDGRWEREKWMIVGKDTFWVLEGNFSCSLVICVVVVLFIRNAGGLFWGKVIRCGPRPPTHLHHYM